MKYQLTEWSVQVDPASDLYQEPRRILKGRRSTDNRKVRTSPIATIAGNLITTASGAQYRLGEPAPEYVQWCRDNKVHIPTAEEPIKLL